MTLFGGFLWNRFHARKFCVVQQHYRISLLNFFYLRPSTLEQAEIEVFRLTFTATEEYHH
jgi:hypothetical protein